MKLLISRPKIPHLSPSPEQTTLEASMVDVTVILSGQPFTCLQMEENVYKMDYFKTLRYYSDHTCLPT